VNVLSEEEASTTTPASTDLLIVGGPTRVHGMSRKPMWELAVKDALQHPEKGIVPDPAAAGTSGRT
jgi:hypothetical protein